ncbi:MAG: tRNA pseudouridine(55) synthase TruB [Tenericutes bacterium HGW-Tenericutes-6]|nr:MAG: tRNA pseudouridine(55) synthase TruB [Tenericutes bacterium HGW-Tenericutes-6]
MDGFLLINKPVGMTSHDVVFHIKRKLHLDKVGHTGTLDPFASGLLILVVGKATKLAHLFSHLDKDYEGTILFNKHYDTYDVTGKLIDQKEMKLNLNDVKNKMLSMVGHYHQLPPMYSALKVDGQKLYDLARKGIEVERETRLVEIKSFLMTSDIEHDMCDFFASVSKGTYIRTLAVDLGEKLGTYAALKHLNRLRVGTYHLKDAKSLDDVDSSDLIPLSSFFKYYPSIVLNDYMIKLVRNGVYLDERQIKTDQDFIVKDLEGHMVAYYEVIKENTYKPVLIF